mgnify:CR=1
MGYIGNEPTTGHFPVDNFTSSGGSTYTLSQAPASAGAIEVSVQGILQSTTAYSISGTTLTMAGVTSGVKIFVRHLGETLVLPTPADGSVTTAKLGVNSVDGTKIAMGSDAAGDILYHGATDYARLAKGTAAQVLTMNAGATAPEWAAAGGGAWTFIAKTTASGSPASITVSGLSSTYDLYAVAIDNLQPANDGVGLSMRFGDSSGIDSGASDYAWQHGLRSAAPGPAAADAISAAASAISLNPSGTHLDMGNASGEGVSGMFHLQCPYTATSTYPAIQGMFSGFGQAVNSGLWITGGTRLAAIDVTQIQIYYTAGNIANGTMTVWGIKKS